MGRLPSPTKDGQTWAKFGAHRADVDPSVRKVGKLVAKVGQMWGECKVDSDMLPRAILGYLFACGERMSEILFAAPAARPRSLVPSRSRGPDEGGSAATVAFHGFVRDLRAAPPRHARKLAREAWGEPEGRSLVMMLLVGAAPASDRTSDGTLCRQRRRCPHMGLNWGCTPGARPTELGGRARSDILSLCCLTRSSW